MENPREPPVVLESKPLKILEEFDSRRLMEDKIIAALKDENTNTIGVCGISGIGKTRMARQIGEKVKEWKLFHIVVMVNVGPSSQLERIAYEISHYLGVRFAANFVAATNELLSRLITKKRILIILDDVHEVLDLEKIGLPLQKHKGSFKVMMTSRNESVCLAMGAQNIFTVQGLTEEEIWIRLKETFDDSSDLFLLARSIAEKCRGSPLVLNFVVKMLKDNNKLWPGMVEENTLKQMITHHNFNHETEVVNVFETEAVDISLAKSSFKIFESRVNLRQGHKGSQIVSPKLVVPLKQRLSLTSEQGQMQRSILAAEDNSVTNVSMSSSIKFLQSTLQELDLRGTAIEVLPGEMRKLINLRLLNLTNCRNLRVIEPGVISSLVQLEELYMLGSFSKWEVEKEGKESENASINELEFLCDLTALQIEIHDPNIVLKNSRIWSRVTMYVILLPEEIKCRFGESPPPSFPSVCLDDYICRRVMSFDLPSLTSLADWMCIMLRSPEYLQLSGDGSKNAVEELIPDGFKLFKHLTISHCSTMEYLVGEADQVLLTNGLFPRLESLCLEDLPLFMEISCCQLPMGLFGKLKNLKLHRLPSLLHVYRSPIHCVSLPNLTSVYISHCPKLQYVFSLSMVQDLVQLKEIKIDYCEMIKEIFSEGTCEDCKMSNKIELPNLVHLELDTLPNLNAFCKNVQIEFPQLKEMSLQSLRKFRTFCPSDSDLPFEGNNVLFSEKIASCSLKKLKIAELDNATNIWCRQLSSSLFAELEELVVESCDNLRNLLPLYVAKTLVQLEHLAIEDCSTMQEIIAEDGEIGVPEIIETLFPKLKTLELRRLPILGSFCHMINGLKLPSLEELTLYDCPGMKGFGGGQVYMPMLKCVKRDLSIYKIDGIAYTVQRLFNEKLLFIHHSWPLSSQYQCREVEEIVEEEVMKGSIHSHPEPSSQAGRGDGDANLQSDINKKVVCSSSSESNTIEEADIDLPKSYGLELEQEDQDEDVLDGCLLVGTKGNEGQRERISTEANLEVSIDTVLQNKPYMKECILFCSLFPSDYEFTKDMLIWQWIAERLIKLRENEMMEEVYVMCFDALLNLDYIVPSGYHYFLEQTKYKVGDEMTVFLQKQLLEPKFQKCLESKQIEVAKVEHLSLSFKDIDSMNFQILRLFSHLQTLIIHGCYGSKLNSLPFDQLKALKILKLSRTNIKALPSSVENLKELRYLDMSETPIYWLPESIGSLTNLQTLILDGCLSLVRLPYCMNQLIDLRHLVLNVFRQLQSMPMGIGNLSKLQTLREFLVGEDDGCRIGELKNMNKLKGSFRLLHLQNVRTKEEAAEAHLCKKHDLKKVELQWSDIQDEKNADEEEILNSLQPPLGIQELKIVFYSGGVLPSWISNPSFNELVSLTLYRCRYCKILPSIGELPSLKFLNVIENNETVEITSLFCRKQTSAHHAAFPKLEKLYFNSMSKLEQWIGLQHGDFPYLRSLTIEYCPKLIGLPFLSHLDSLLHVEINYCPEILCLPKYGLPRTLESLMIKDCPKLKERCCNERCEDWFEVARLLEFYIDNRKVSLK